MELTEWLIHITDATVASHAAFIIAMYRRYLSIAVNSTRHILRSTYTHMVTIKVRNSIVPIQTRLMTGATHLHHRRLHLYLLSTRRISTCFGIVRVCYRLLPGYLFCACADSVVLLLQPHPLCPS